MKTIRTIEVSNGEINRTMEIVEIDGVIKLHDTADVNYDSCIELADESDTSIQDALSDGFEIV